MKYVFLTFTLLVSSSVFATKYKRLYGEYLKRSGQVSVYDRLARFPSEYLIPLNKETDELLQKLKQHQCIIIEGTHFKDEYIFARSVKLCE